MCGLWEWPSTVLCMERWVMCWYHQSDSSNSSLWDYLSEWSMDGAVCYCSDICVMDNFDHSSVSLLYLSLLLCFSSLSSSAHLLMSTYWHFTIRSRVSRWSSPRRKSPLYVYCCICVLSGTETEEMSEMFECMAMWAKCSIYVYWFSMIFVYAHAGPFDYVDEVCLLCVEGQRPWTSHQLMKAHLSLTHTLFPNVMLLCSQWLN